MQSNHELLDLLVTNDARACVFLLNLLRLHTILRISPANRGVFFFIFFFLLALHWNSCMCIQDIACFVLALLIWNLPDFYPWWMIACGVWAASVPGFWAGVVEVPFILLHLDLQQLLPPCRGLQKVSRENKASVRISECNPLVCTFFGNLVGFCQADQVDHCWLWLLL